MEPGAESLARLFNLQVRLDPQAANELAERWLKSHPDDQRVRRLLAASYARMGKLAQARSAYEAIVAAVPDDAESLNNLANVLVLQRDPKALQVAERALAAKPGAAHIIGTTGWAAHLAGQDDRALQLLRDARLRDPNNPDTRYFLGAVLASKGRRDEAREELRVAMNAGTGSSFSAQARDLFETLK
jgi:Flp pilus assembly protein TadD